MIKKLADGIWKLNADSNLYYYEEHKLLIDTGARSERKIVETFLSKVVDFKEIKHIILTHLHYDHIGNFDLFPNAKFYASAEAVIDFEKNKNDTILNPDIVDRFNVKLHIIDDNMFGLEVIKCPGHTRGSICLWDEKEKILFTGDTLLLTGNGRIDLPTSDPKRMQSTLNKLIDYNFKILATGHDY